MRSYNMLIMVSMGNLSLSFRRWDYSSILRAAVSPFISIGVTRLCISIVVVVVVVVALYCH